MHQRRLLEMRERDPLSFKLADAASYDRVAEVFDRLSDRVSSPMAARLIELAEVRAGERVLDVGTGTGIVARRAARAAPNLEIVGVDLSKGMLEVAQARTAGAGLTGQVRIGRMDAEHLGLANGSFDAVVSLFALAHFPNPAGALREMYRVLRPGGRLVVGVGSGPTLLRSVVRRPVADVVFRLICRMHSRLHVEIMRLWPSR